MLRVETCKEVVRASGEMDDDGRLTRVHALYSVLRDTRVSQLSRLLLMLDMHDTAYMQSFFPHICSYIRLSVLSCTNCQFN